MLGDSRKLSKAAREKYNQLLGQVQELISGDENREPRLTETEKAEVEGLEARRAQLKPIIPKLNKSLDERTARRGILQRNITTMVIDGGNVDELADEINRLERTIEILSEALRSALFENAAGAQSIANIKERARNRELREEEHAQDIG